LLSNLVFSASMLKQRRLHTIMPSGNWCRSQGGQYSVSHLFTPQNDAMCVLIMPLHHLQDMAGDVGQWWTVAMHLPLVPQGWADMQCNERSIHTWNDRTLHRTRQTDETASPLPACQVETIATKLLSVTASTVHVTVCSRVELLLLLVVPVRSVHGTNRVKRRRRLESLLQTRCVLRTAVAA